jgi:hypothetical protein
MSKQIARLKMRKATTRGISCTNSFSDSYVNMLAKILLKLIEITVINSPVHGQLGSMSGAD